MHTMAPSSGNKCIYIHNADTITVTAPCHTKGPGAANAQNSHCTESHAWTAAVPMPDVTSFKNA